MGQLLTLDDIGERLGVSKDTLYKWRCKGHFPRSLRLPNGSVRVVDADLDHWLETLERV